MSDSVQLIGAIGQIGMRKGLDVLLAAAEDFLPRHGNGHLVIVGQRYSEKREAVEHERELIRAAATEALAGRVHFLGTRTDVSRLLNELTVLVHAARQEPLGRVLLEAAASGCPVIATRVGGTLEIFPEEVGAAVLVAPDDPRGLSDAVERVLGDADVRATLSARTRRRAVDAFGSVASAERLAMQYRSACGS